MGIKIVRVHSYKYLRENDETRKYNDRCNSTVPKWACVEKWKDAVPKWAGMTKVYQSSSKNGQQQKSVTVHFYGTGQKKVGYKKCMSTFLKAFAGKQ